MNEDRAFWLSGGVVVVAAFIALLSCRLAGASDETSAAILFLVTIPLALGASFFCARYMDRPNRRR